MRLALSLPARLVGLLDSRICPQGEVLLLAPCRSIHTWGMRGPIDVAFIDRFGRVLKAVPALPPRSRLRCPGAFATLERRCLPGAYDEWFTPGQALRFV